MESVKEWLRVDRKDGSGSGSGWGSGEGSGWGSGWGSGSGSGSGLKEINGYDVYQVDDVPTTILSVHLSLAKGFIVREDLSLVPCYVAKGDGYFAHGETPQGAQEALRQKIFENMAPDEAIEKFCEIFKDGERYSGHDFFEWHHYLTGSCEMGRKNFVASRGIDLDKTYTVEEFIALTEQDYGREVIRKLKAVQNEKV